MMMMEGKTDKNKVRGCIKSSRGPWVVHRRTNRGVVTCLRFSTEREWQNNKERERRRREITRRIYAGLRARGNYKLPQFVMKLVGLLRRMAPSLGRYSSIAHIPTQHPRPKKNPCPPPQKKKREELFTESGDG